MSDKLLTQTQAETVYNAMVMLNNVTGCLHARLLTGDTVIHVKEYITDEINVWHGDANGHPMKPYGTERYANQREFACAYGILGE